MFKKTVILSLVISLLASMFVFAPVSAEEAGAETSTESRYEGQSMIEILGIINSNTDSAEKKVTREMFAVYMARMLKIDINGTTNVRYFTDLEYDAFSVAAVNALVERNIISVSDDHLFRPGEYITSNEALKMVLCVLGYGQLADASGGYPTGYVKLANRIKLNGYLGNGDTITVGQAGTMIYNALCTRVYETKSFGSDGITFNQSEDTFLKMYWDIADDYGTLEAVYGATVLEDTYPEKNEAYINGVKYEVKDGVDITEYFENYIHFFYNAQDNKKGGDIIYVEVESDEEDFVIDPKDFVSYSDKKISYYDKREKLVTKELADPVVVYNGTVLGDKFDEVMAAIDKGSIVLKDSDNDGRYDAVVISDYRGFVISSLNKQNNALYDNVGMTDDIVLGNYETFIVTNGGGDELSWNELAAGQVLSVASSYDKKIAKLIIETKTISGKLNAMRGRDELSIVVDDKTYEVDDMFIDYFKSRCQIGKSYTFTLDSFGKIAYVTALADDWLWGYVLGGATDEFSDVSQIKMMNDKGEIKIYDCEGNVTVDGNIVKGAAIANAVKNDDGSYYRIIRYQIKDDKIKKIDTSKLGEKEDKNTSVYDIFAGADNSQLWYTNKRIGIRALLDADTVIFCRPSGNNIDDEDMYMLKLSELRYDGKYTVDAFKPGITAAYTGALVVYDTVAGLANSSPTCFIVDEVYETIYGDETVTAIDGYQNGAKSTVYDDEGMDFSGVSRGDIVSFNYDRDGTLRRKSNDKGYDMIYDCSTRDGLENFFDAPNGFKIYTKGGADTQYYRSSGAQLSYGKVLAKRGTVIEISPTGEFPYTEAFETNGYYVLVYDKEADKLSIGSVDDIIDKESSTLNASEIFVETNASSMKGVIVYNNK